ncbi:MAG TPA: hypothetical protein VGM85_04415 [Paraburkholderia sp.]|jgi:hypothetical protein
MLTAEQNETLTRVGPGTLMGNLMRNYWQAIGALGFAYSIGLLRACALRIRQALASRSAAARRNDDRAMSRVRPDLRDATPWPSSLPGDFVRQLRAPGGLA